MLSWGEHNRQRSGGPAAGGRGLRQNPPITGGLRAEPKGFCCFLKKQFHLGTLFVILALLRGLKNFIASSCYAPLIISSSMTFDVFHLSVLCMFAINLTVWNKLNNYNQWVAVQNSLHQVDCCVINFFLLFWLKSLHKTEIIATCLKASLM